MRPALYGFFVVLLLVGTGATARAQDDLLEDLGKGEDVTKGKAAEAQPKAGAAASDDLSAPLDSIDAPLSDVDKPKTAAPAAPAAGEAPAATPEKPEASEAVADPRLLDRIKAVPRKAVLKAARLEIAPMYAVSLNDPFYTHMSIGGSLVFYPQDAFGIGLGAEYLLAHVRTGRIREVRESLISVPAVYDLPSLFAHLDLYFVPIYGKVSLFDTFIVHFDAYASVGFGIATAFNGKVPPLANFAIGQRFLLNDWLAVRLELRDAVFNDTFLVEGQERSDLQNYMMFNVGVSVFVPPSFEYSLL